MKKLHLLFAGAFAAFALVACSDDELETETTTEDETETDEGNTGDETTGDEEDSPEAYITLGEAELQFGRTGGEATVTVDANYDWNAEYESDWFTVVADINAGTLTVTCDANGTGEVREGPGPFSDVTSFYYAFFECESLTTVPEDIFSGCTSAYDFGGVFDECVSLGSVPVGIFDDNKLMTEFEYVFNGCSKMNGESPYTIIGGNKVHLYERENYPDYFTAPRYYARCFTGCTGLDDYYSIPSSWGGGGSSPNSITPQSLNATGREERSPSRLGPQRATMGPRRDAATPQGSAARPLPTRK